MSSDKNRFFQFLAGERQGEILVFDEIEKEDDMIFINFKDGSRCNEEYILPINETDWNGKLMAEIESTKNPWKFDTKWVGKIKERKAEDADGKMVIVDPGNPGKKTTTPLPPAKTRSNFGYIDKAADTSAPTPAAVKVEETKSIILTDPVFLMMDKAKKFDTEVEMSLVLSLPAKSLFEVAKESFEKGDEKVIEYIINNLDNKMIKNKLQEALKNAYGMSETQLEIQFEVEDPAK